MATAWCPECRGEYREGIAVCADCGVELVATPPSPATQHHEVRGPFLPDGDFVEVTRVHATEADAVVSQLRGAGIPAAVFGVGTAGELAALQYSEGSRVMVRRADLAAAESVCRDLFGVDGGTAPIDDEELAALAERAAGWSDPETGAVV